MRRRALAPWCPFRRGLTGLCPERVSTGATQLSTASAAGQFRVVRLDHIGRGGADGPQSSAPLMRCGHCRGIVPRSVPVFCAVRPFGVELVLVDLATGLALCKRNPDFSWALCSRVRMWPGWSVFAGQSSQLGHAGLGSLLARARGARACVIQWFLAFRCCVVSFLLFVCARFASRRSVGAACLGPGMATRWGAWTGHPPSAL